MKMMKQNQRRQLQVDPVLEQADDQRPSLPDWSQFWPADSGTETGSDALLQESLTELEQGSVQERLAGYRSETQGQ